MKRLLLILTLAPVQAGAFDLAWPVDCTNGETCFVQNYFDHDASPDDMDFTCGPLTYDGHDGTDISVNSLAAMRDGFAVRAAADGMVRGIRDGMQDIRVNDPAAPYLDGRDCGNGVAIDHGDGWETQYCHMKQGSIRVQEGQMVKVGDQLGLVGLSGKTVFPHLHLTLRKDGLAQDPFDPLNTQSSCHTDPPQSLWASPVPYVAGGIINVGFATEVPPYELVKAGLPPPSIAPDAPTLVMWVYTFGGRAGDAIVFDITGPDGHLMAKRIVLKRTQAQQYRIIKKARSDVRWPPGTYSGTATLVRNGLTIDTFTQTTAIID